MHWLRTVHSTRPHWRLALTMLSTPAWAIYQCQDPATGRTTFQERPCEATGMRGKQIEVRPSTLGATGSATATTAGTAQQLRAQSERHAKERRLRDLNAHDIPNAQARARSAASRCKERMDAVGRKKSSASNNLAGASWSRNWPRNPRNERTQNKH